MPQLQENSPALGVHGIGHLAPSLYLRLRVNARGVLIALSLLGYLRGFGNQQTRAGPLAVIGSSKFTRHKAFACAIARQWSENHAVRQRQGAKRVRGKQILVAHGCVFRARW